MKLVFPRGTRGFTLAEMLVSVAVSAIILTALFAGAMALNRAYAATDDYFSTHIQQIRIIDYLARDVKRSYSVTATNNGQTVTCIMPNYVIKSGDPEAVTDSTTIGQRRTPVVTGPPYSATVNYGTRNTRTVVDAVTTNGSKTVTSASAAFTSTDVGNPVSCTTVPAGTTISAVTSATSITLSANATGTGSGKTFTVYGDGDRTITDGVTTSGSTTLTSATAYFTSVDVGKAIVGASLNALTTISSVTNSTTVVLSSAANATVTSSTVTIGGTVVVYNVSGKTITRTENGVVTTVASATDQIMPTTTDWQLSNTEYTTSNVTFIPTFVHAMSSTESGIQQAGTTIYSTAYLRNKRRGN
jgi:prepilin-type N-terminal cleavage/methylation domain-containing protein